MRIQARFAVLFGLALLALAPLTSQADSFHVTNLVSNIEGMALITDPLLQNPWGVSYGATGPFWVSNAGTSTATLYSGDVAGSDFTKVSLEVNVPGSPTGQVNNNTTEFGGAIFIFAGRNGSISAWSPPGTQAEVKARVDGASYTGLAIGQDSQGNNRLYAANVRFGSIDVFDGNFERVFTPDLFTDPDLDANFHPFNIQNLNGVLYVTYQDQGNLDHGGVVNAFDTDGNLLGRVAGGDPLNAPWGLVIAPDGFGAFSGTLLVGNFGDGTINAFDPTPGGTGFIDTLTDENGDPIVLDDLWMLIVGNGTMAGDTNAVYFTAGINEEQDGLFGSIRLVK